LLDESPPDPATPETVPNGKILDLHDAGLIGRHELQVPDDLGRRRNGDQDPSQVDVAVELLRRVLRQLEEFPQRLAHPVVPGDRVFHAPSVRAAAQ